MDVCGRTQHAFGSKGGSGPKGVLRHRPQASVFRRECGGRKTQYGKALETAEKELTSLEKEPVRWLSIQEKGTKRIELKGYQDTPTFGREIRISGRTQKTEKGFEFIPETSRDVQ